MGAVLPPLDGAGVASPRLTGGAEVVGPLPLAGRGGEVRPRPRQRGVVRADTAGRLRPRDPPPVQMVEGPDEEGAVATACQRGTPLLIPPRGADGGVATVAVATPPRVGAGLCLLHPHQTLPREGVREPEPLHGVGEDTVALAVPDDVVGAAPLPPIHPVAVIGAAPPREVDRPLLIAPPVAGAGALLEVAAAGRPHEVIGAEAPAPEGPGVDPAHGWGGPRGETADDAAGQREVELLGCQLDVPPEGAADGAPLHDVDVADGAGTLVAGEAEDHGAVGSDTGAGYGPDDGAPLIEGGPGLDTRPGGGRKTAAPVCRPLLGVAGPTGAVLPVHVGVAPAGARGALRPCRPEVIAALPVGSLRRGPPSQGGETGVRGAGPAAWPDVAPSADRLVGIRVTRRRAVIV